MEPTLAPEIDLLLEQLKSSDPGDRRMAAASLGKRDCHDESVRSALEAAAIDDPDSFASIEAAYALEELGFPIQNQPTSHKWTGSTVNSND
jgi:HEAT repeat protein